MSAGHERRGVVDSVRPVRTIEAGATSLGVSVLALSGSDDARRAALVRVRIVPSHGRDAVSMRLGPRLVAQLVTALCEAAEIAFPGRWRSPLPGDEPEDHDRDHEQGRGTLAAPGLRDDVYEPGAPWRRGRWVGPVPRAPRWSRTEGAEP